MISLTEFMAVDLFVLAESVKPRHVPSYLKCLQCVDKYLLNKAAKTNMKNMRKLY